MEGGDGWRMVRCGGDGWRMVRCGGGAQDNSHNTSLLNQIMLRFRPIAPKPVTGGSGSGESPAGKSNSVAPRGRTKRKYVRIRKNEDVNVKEKVDGKRVVTLQLLPEIEKSSEQSAEGGSSCCEFDSSIGMNHQWLSLSKIGRENDNYMKGDPAADPTAVIEQMGGGVESWVTVECVAGTCMKAPLPSQGFGIISTDEERVRFLDVDTSPGFVSDGWNRVLWLNGAFRRMVMMSWQQQMQEIAVWLAMNEELPCSYSAFTCQVKLRYTVGNKEKQKYYYSQMVPCDLWRMNGGGFAWRLDVKAALTLAVDAAPFHISKVDLIRSV